MPIERELSLRALLTGMLLGVLLTPSNVYAGLKIGWSFNMSIIALLIGFGFWQGLAARLWNGAAWTLHESNINQTVASAAASIVSGGLVAPIPVLALLTGQVLPALPMMAWVFSVSFLGIWIAWYLRPSLLRDAELKFPEGMATLETLTHIYSHGGEAGRRLAVLFGTTLLSGVAKWADDFFWAFPRWAPTAQLERLTFTFDPSLLLVGFGGIIGIRVGVSLLLGAVLARDVIAPWLLSQGLVVLPAHSSGPQFSTLVGWLLWPGVSLMVCATLISFALRLYKQHRDSSARSEPLAQRGFGVLAPGQVAVNLMIANTAGGAAGQCTDLMNDFKVGHAIGATPSKQVIAQCMGIALGSVVGVLVYRALIPDPQAMLLTTQWPAPAAATWKAVAQTMTAGLASLSTSSRWAILLGGLGGLVLGAHRCGSCFGPHKLDAGGRRRKSSSGQSRAPTVAACLARFCVR